MRMVGGSAEDGRFTAVYEHRGRVVGALSWNAPRELRALRELLVLSDARGGEQAYSSPSS